MVSYFTSPVNSHTGSTFLHRGQLLPLLKPKRKTVGVLLHIEQGSPGKAFQQSQRPYHRGKLTTSLMFETPER
jgi:hypothetical protein